MLFGVIIFFNGVICGLLPGQLIRVDGIEEKERGGGRATRASSPPSSTFT